MKLLTIKLRLSIAFLFSLVLTASAPLALGQEPLASGSPAAPALVQSDLTRRQEAFQIVWQTVNDLFYDPKFGGVNWANVRERYEPLVARAGSDREFHILLQQMLNELHQSHFMVIPREAIPKIRVTKDPDDSATGDKDDLDAEEALNNVNYKLTDRLSRAWLQDPLQGFIRFTGLGLEIARDGAVFNKQAKLKQLYPSAILIGKEKVGGKEAYVVRMGFEKWFFDAEGGLLLRKGNTYYDDYREVDGVKLPFKMREEVFSAVGLIYQLSEIKHNVKIDEAKFTAYPSCFTKP